MQLHIQGFIAYAFYLIGSGWIVLHCAHRTSDFLFFTYSSEAAGVVSIARMERPPFHHGGSASTETMSAVSPFSLQARSISLQGWGLTDLPLRASNEGLLRPRVARAQKIIRLHPFSPYVISRVAWLILDCARRTSTFLLCAFREQEDDQATLNVPIFARE